MRSKLFCALFVVMTFRFQMDNHILYSLKLCFERFFYLMCNIMNLL